MRRTLFVCAALAVLFSFSGCAGGGLGAWLRCRGTARQQPGPEMIQAGPPTGAVAYPYYTTRGPRDFLAAEPPSIGPR